MGMPPGTRGRCRTGAVRSATDHPPPDGAAPGRSVSHCYTGCNDASRSLSELVEHASLLVGEPVLQLAAAGLRLGRRHRGSGIRGLRLARSTGGLVVDRAGVALDPVVDGVVDRPADEQD